MLSLSIVIPLYNEEERLKKSLPILKNFIKKNKKYSDIIKEVYKRDIDFLPIYK